MRIETETAVRSIVGFDSEVTKELVERAIDILRGKTDADSGEITVHNVRFSDAMDILKVKRRTLRHYIYRGYLDRVYDGGCRARGYNASRPTNIATFANYICYKSFAKLLTSLRCIGSHDCTSLNTP